MIYLDNAATTRTRDEVFTAMLPYLREEYGNPSSVYELGRRARAALDKARKQVATAIHANFPREIFFTSCGTESNNWAIKGAAFALKDKGKHIITTKAEHHAVLDTCEFLEKVGFDVTFLDVDEFGGVSLEDVKHAVRDDTILISIMFANNEVGTINPIPEIGDFAHSKGILFHTDAVQAVGHIPVDVGKMNIDMLSLTGHKFYAPKGVGALYVREGIEIEKFMHGGAQERKRRAGTENLALIAGMGAAIELAVAEMDNKDVIRMRDRMISRILTEIPSVKLNGHPENRLPGNINISVEYVESEAVLFNLDLDGIACSSGSACTSGSTGASHVLTAMGVPIELSRGSLRFSIGRYNTDNEIDKAINALKRTVDRIRGMSPLCSGKCCKECDKLN